LQDDGEILLCPDILRSRGGRFAQLVEGIRGLVGGRRMLLAPFARGRERGRLRLGSAGRLRQIDERRIVGVSPRSEKPSRPWLCAIFYQDEVVALPQLAGERLLVEARGMNARSSWTSFPFSHTRDAPLAPR